MSSIAWVNWSIWPTLRRRATRETPLASTVRRGSGNTPRAALDLHRPQLRRTQIHHRELLDMKAVTITLAVIGIGLSITDFNWAAAGWALAFLWAVLTEK